MKDRAELRGVSRTFQVFLEITKCSYISLITIEICMQLRAETRVFQCIGPHVQYNSINRVRDIARVPYRAENRMRISKRFYRTFSVACRITIMYMMHCLFNDG